MAKSKKTSSNLPAAAKESMALSSHLERCYVNPDGLFFWNEKTAKKHFGEDFEVIENTFFHEAKETPQNQNKN